MIHTPTAVGITADSNGRRRVIWICGVCGVPWPCEEKFHEVARRATQKREIQKSNIREYTNRNGAWKISRTGSSDSPRQGA